MVDMSGLQHHDIDMKPSALRDTDNMSRCSTMRGTPTLNEGPQSPVHFADQDDMRDVDLERGDTSRTGKGGIETETRTLHSRASATTLVNITEEELDRLARKRPDAFRNWFFEAVFVFSVIMSQILAEFFVSGFNVLLPKIIDIFDIPSAVSVWPASAFSLVIGATLLPFGRLADMLGGYNVYIAGLIWTMIWSIVCGFSQNKEMLIVCRALQGLGPAMFLPAGVMLLANTYRPGPRKNIVFSMYATCSCLGFFVGIFFSGLAAQLMSWKWYFFIGAACCAVTLCTTIFFVPSDGKESRERGIKMDWWGTGLIVTGLALVVFALTQSAHAPKGWRNPYISILFCVGWVLLGAAYYVEGWVAEQPLLPFDVFHVKHMKPFVLALFFFLGCSGIVLFYGTNYMQNLMHATPLRVVSWYLPMLVGGLTIPIFLGFFLHKISATILLTICNAAWIMMGVLFAIAKPDAPYWAYVFPSMICSTLGIDIVWDIAHIFITTNQSKDRQGLCGALINSVLHLGIATLLGVADIVHEEVVDKSDKLTGYRAVFWFQVGCAAISAVLMIAFVRIKKQKSELTVDEKRAIEAQKARQAEATGMSGESKEVQQQV